MATFAESGTPGRLLALLGPTAVGKSGIALHLAEQLNGEIISVDSMQVYRGMDIGTAKPSTRDRARVPHHLIDIVELTSSFDVARFVRLAQQATEDIHRRGRVPILCGGTGLYFKAFFEGLGQVPSSDPAVRAALEKTPLADLLAELSERDPLTYQQIDRQNIRRVVRAVEVIRATGRPYSSQRAEWSRLPSPPRGMSIVGLGRESADLQNRIAFRVDTMFQQGLVAETKALIEAGLGGNRTAMQALGYRQVAEHLQQARSLAETIALIKTRTRQLARRQMTWFRRQLPVHWINVAPTSSAQSVVAEVIRTFSDPVPPIPPSVDKP